MVDRAERDARTVFVRNLDYSVDWMTLKDHMQECGPVDYVRVAKNRDTHESRGFATVVFQDQAGATRAIAELSDTEFEGRRMFVREHQRPPAFQDPHQTRDSGRKTLAHSTGSQNYTAAANKVFVGNLSWTTTSEELEAYIREATTSEVEVVKCQVLGYEDGRSKGVAIVEFANAEDASVVIDKLNQTQMHGRTLFLREDRGSQRQEDEKNLRRQNNHPSGRQYQEHDDEEEEERF